MRSGLLKVAQFLGSIGVLSALTYLGVHALRAQRFSVERVLWEGPQNQIVDEREVLEWLDIQPGKTALSDVDPLNASALLATHPWVDRASIHVEYPNQIRIQVEARHAVAVWFSGKGGPKFLTETGEVFGSILDPRESDLPGIWAPADALKTLLPQLSRLKLKHPSIWQRLESVVAEPSGALRLYFDAADLGPLVVRFDSEKVRDFALFWPRFEKVVHYLREHKIYADSLEWAGGEKIVVKTRKGS